MKDGSLSWLHIVKGIMRYSSSKSLVGLLV